jgi:hypothetical protein
VRHEAPQIPEEEPTTAASVDGLQEATVAEPIVGLKIKLSLKPILEAQLK